MTITFQRRNSRIHTGVVEFITSNGWYHVNVGGEIIKCRLADIIQKRKKKKKVDSLRTKLFKLNIQKRTKTSY
jgi:hypothetical protein